MPVSISPFTTAISKTQIWGRKEMSDLWAQRTTLLGADETEHLNRLYRARTGTGLHQSQDISYRTSQKSEMGRAGYGRLYGYGGYSLEQVPSEIRGTLCRGVYHDIDIINCHPTLLAALAVRYGYTLPQLTAYCESRDVILAQLQAEMGCTRGEAKAETLKVFFGGATSQPILRPLANEIRQFALVLLGHEDWCGLGQYAARDNHLFSFLSGVLQTVERSVLLAMTEHITDLGWQVDVLAYDGFMVRKRAGEAITPELLAAVAAHVKETTGYEITLAEKPMNSLLPEAVAAGPSVSDAAYADMKSRFEENAFYFRETNTIVRVSPKHGVRHLTAEHARDAFNTTEWSLPGAKEDDTFIKRWLKDPKRRIVDSMVYKYAADCAEDEASLFTGFAYKEMTGEDPTAIALFMDLLRCATGDEEDTMEYVLRYFAHILQKPFEIAGTALVFTSWVHGTGKDTLVGIVSEIVGRHTALYTSNRHFWDSHDIRKEGALLLHLQESSADAAKSNAEELKALITSPHMSINPKGLRPYTVPNMGRLIMTTNKPDPIKLEGTDRRFVIMRPTSRLHARGADWWASIQAQIHSPEFLGTVGRYLESVCLVGWNPRKIPMSEDKAELMELSKPSELLFLEESIAAATAASIVPAWQSIDELYTDYKLWWSAKGMPPLYMAQSANKLATKLIPWKNSHFVKSRRNTGMAYQITPTV